MITCPASWALLENVVPLPITQSWATCEYASSQLPSPIVVTPLSCVVPAWIVTNSRMTLPSPITVRVGSPVYFLSCGISPTDANWNIRLLRPMLVRSAMTTCAPMLVPAPIVVSPPTTVYGPITTSPASSALAATIAVGWTRVTSVRCRATRPAIRPPQPARRRRWPAPRTFRRREPAGSRSIPGSADRPA